MQVPSLTHLQRNSDSSNMFTRSYVFVCFLVPGNSGLPGGIPCPGHTFLKIFKEKLFCFVGVVEII